MTAVAGLLKGFAISAFGWAVAYVVYIMMYSADATNPMNLITLIVLIVGCISFIGYDFLIGKKLLTRE